MSDLIQLGDMLGEILKETKISKFALILNYLKAEILRYLKL